MSKEDTAQGLLSKMVKFVRNPATNWSDLDNKDTDREAAVSKQMLKEMIERKRRNDFVRKREFDMLRKMRKREVIGGQDPEAKPSFFQSSMPSKPDDRAQTLKKIDEIEAQMSMQWWKTKQGNSSVAAVTVPASVSTQAPESASPVQTSASARRGPSAAGLPVGYGATEPMSLEASQAIQAGSNAVGARSATTPPTSVNMQSLEFSMPPVSVPMAAPAPVSMSPIGAPQRPMIKSAGERPLVTARAPARPAMGGLSAAGGDYSGNSTGFSVTNMMAVDVSEIAHDAELEEASIRFANGDDSGAEAGLLEMLAPTGARVSNPESWMVLFDLYRATGEQDKFESIAIDFLQRFDRSAPQWFSMPAMFKQLVVPGAKAPGNGPAADWVCPSLMGIQTVAALKAAVGKAPMPWRLDWSKLKTIDLAAVEPLCNLFGSWSAQPVQLRFIGDSQLQQVLESATPSNIVETPQSWWQLRMEALRVMHRPDEFELTALDFCVTYELSPPAWEAARCEYKPINPDGLALSGHTIIGDAYLDSHTSGISQLDGDSRMDGSNSVWEGGLAIELSGQIQGDAIEVLDQLEAKSHGSDNMTISCAKLIRVDFSAAGTLLNWVSAREAENRSVQFSEVNRLVAAFFNVIGITEHARVGIRRD